MSAYMHLEIPPLVLGALGVDQTLILSRLAPLGPFDSTI